MRHSLAVARKAAPENIVKSPATKIDSVTKLSESKSGSALAALARRWSEEDRKCQLILKNTFEPFSSCGQDSDCMTIQLGTCFPEGAINKINLEKFNNSDSLKQAKEFCSLSCKCAIDCASHYTAKCIKGKCAVVEKSALKSK